MAVGASDDVCASLLETYYEYDPQLDGGQFTHFTFDLVPPEHRVERLTDRVRELRPLHILGIGSPNSNQGELAKGEEPPPGMPVVDEATQPAHR